MKSTNTIKGLEETAFAKDKLIKELESKMKAHMTDTLDAKKDVETKDKIILSLNSKIKTMEEEKSKMKSEASKAYDSLKNELIHEQKEKESVKSSF